MNVAPLNIPDDAHVLVLTGAGISAESGVPTFRDLNGLWNNYSVEEVASPSGFESDPARTWKFYSERRVGLMGVEPNAGHYSLVELEKRLGDRFLLVTQNVDGLHRKAGSERVIELHGNIHRSKCHKCNSSAFADFKIYDGVLPKCKSCSGGVRPDIVWFGEQLPVGSMELICSFIDWSANNLLFVAVGTSGNVYPAAIIATLAKTYGAKTSIVNLEYPANVLDFDDVIIGKAGETLPILFRQNA